MIPMTASVFSDLFADSLLNVVYATALLIGVVYALFLLFFQGLGEAFGDLDLDLDLDLDVDVDAGDFDSAGEAAGVSMLAIASFISTFGAFGLVSVTLFDAGSVASLVTALIGGTLMGLAAQAFFVYILSPTVSSEVRQAKLIGLVGEITTSVPASGLGQIALIAQGSRITYSARATTEGEIIARGTPVRIERIVGNVAYVSRLD